MRFLHWLRWPLLPPVALVVGYLVGGLSHLIHVSFTSLNAGLYAPIGYPAAFLSGLVHVWATLSIAHMVAPTHKKIAVIVLGFFLVGDLVFVHLVLPDLMSDAVGFSSQDAVIGIILSALRAGDYDALMYGGFANVAGAVVGCYLVWRSYFQKQATLKPEH